VWSPWHPEPAKRLGPCRPAGSGEAPGYNIDARARIAIDDFKEPDVADTADTSNSKLSRGDVLDIRAQPAGGDPGDRRFQHQRVILVLRRPERRLAGAHRARGSTRGGAGRPDGGFRIDDEDLEDLRTVRDAVDYVTAKLESA